MASVHVRNCVRFYTTADEIGAESLKEHCSSLISAHWVSRLVFHFLRIFFEVSVALDNQCIISKKTQISQLFSTHGHLLLRGELLWTGKSSALDNVIIQIFLEFEASYSELNIMKMHCQIEQSRKFFNRNCGFRGSIVLFY